ncbi:MAG: septum site-determining protein MinC [Chloroflexi bacterium]|nr:septum site-determining protein MinC [Chloroflexota bacterium]
MISIKGLRQGLLVVFDESPWLSQLRELESKLNANSHFFKGGQIALDVKTLLLTADELQRAQTLLQQYDVTLWAVLSQNESTNETAHKLGFSDTLSGPPTQFAGEGEEHEQDGTAGGNAITEGTDGLLVRRRVRSGQVLRHPGHIVVIGDVNPGAQLIAGGDIIVWGKLQGVAHAGALGDSGAMICALELTPSLIKIADAARGSVNGRLSDGHRRSRSRKPEMARLEQEEINIVAWQEK